MARKHPAKPGLGEALREVRERLRYSQDGLGKELSVSGALISRWEMGSVKPTLDSLARFADLAGKTEEERDALYMRWLRLAGYRGIADKAAPAPPPMADPHAVTLEGAMVRAIVDQEPDQERRWEMVRLLREWALQTQAGGAGTDATPDAAPSPREYQEPHGALAMQGTET